MIDRYGRWIAALIMIALLLAVVILFGTVDLGMDGNTLTDIHSAPILSGNGPGEDEGYPSPETENPPQSPESPTADD